MPGGDFSSNVPSGGGGGFQSQAPSVGGFQAPSGGFQASSGGISGGFQAPSGGIPGGFQAPSGSQFSGAGAGGGGGGNAFSSGAPASQSRFGRLAQFGMNSQAAQQGQGGGDAAAHLQHFQKQQQFGEQSNAVAKPAASGFGRHRY